MNCEICNKELKDIKGLSVHLVKNHKYTINDKKLYYDKYFKKQDEGVCPFCKNESRFIDLTRGYHKICGSKECLGKTRATGTYEFLMYKYYLSKDDAIKLQNERALNRGEKIKETMDNRIKENPNFHKEKSHQTKEYWLKRGLSENDAIEKVSVVMKNIHNKTWEKRRNNPELYKNINTTQIDYWKNKGFNENEAKNKISERQKTFSLEKCIEKYGEIEGRQKWLDRQEKWIKNYKKNNFSKISQKLFWEIYEKIEKRNDIYFATLKNGLLDNSGKNNEYGLRLNDGFVLPDFFIKNEKKIIEFDGTYYHRDNPENIKRSYIRDEKLKMENFIVLHISEYDYKKDKEATIQKCIDFLNS